MIKCFDEFLVRKWNKEQCSVFYVFLVAKGRSCRIKSCQYIIILILFVFRLDFKIILLP